MATMFDWLPLDVIKYEILPFVADEYFARMGINSILHPLDRISTPLRNNAIAELQMSIATRQYKNTNLNGNEYTTSASERAKMLISIFDFNTRNSTFLKYDIKYRNALILKVQQYSDPNFPQYHSVSQDEKTQLVSKAMQFTTTLANTPYLHEVKGVEFELNWSPIDGAKPRSVIDNTALLEAAERKRRSQPHWRNIVEYHRHTYAYHDYADREYREYGYFDTNNKWVTLQSFRRNSDSDSDYSESE